MFGLTSSLLKQIKQFLFLSSLQKVRKMVKKKLILNLSLGPVLGLSTTIHGDEAKGITIFQKIFKMIDLTRLSGTLMTV
jgi:predicted deacylase